MLVIVLNTVSYNIHIPHRYEKKLCETVREQMHMRVNIAWAELQRGKGKTTVFLVRSHPLLANNCGATTCLFSLSHRSGENPSYRSRKFVELTKTHISSHYFLQAAAQFFKLQMIKKIPKMFNFSRLYTGR